MRGRWKPTQRSTAIWLFKLLRLEGDLSVRSLLEQKFFVWVVVIFGLLAGSAFALGSTGFTRLYGIMLLVLAVFFPLIVKGWLKSLDEEAEERKRDA